MAGGRSVQDQDRHIGGLHHVQHRCNEGAGVEGNGLPRLQVDLDAVSLPDVQNQALQCFKVVSRAGDVMPRPGSAI